MDAYLRPFIFWKKCLRPLIFRKKDIGEIDKNRKIQSKNIYIKIVYKSFFRMCVYVCVVYVCELYLRIIVCGRVSDC